MAVNEAPLYQNIPAEPQYGETQQIEGQQAAAPLAQETAAPGTVTEAPAVAPIQATQEQPAPEGEVPPESEETTAAINPGTPIFPPFEYNYDRSVSTLTNEQSLAMALLGRPGITAMTRRLAVALMEETGGLDFTDTLPQPSAVDLETVGQEPEAILNMAKEETPEAVT